MTKLLLGYVFQMMFELRFPVTCARHVSPDTCDIVASPSFPVIPLFQTTLISVLTDAERFDRIFYLALE